MATKEDDKEQIAYLRAWKAQQQEKDLKLEEISRQVSDKKISLLQGIVRSVRTRVHYMNCPAPDVPAEKDNGTKTETDGAGSDTDNISTDPVMK